MNACCLPAGQAGVAIPVCRQVGFHRSVPQRSVGIILPNVQLSISTNIDELNWRVAEWIVDSIHEDLQQFDRFTIVLSGGSTPKKLYQLLASEEFNSKIDWQRLHVFWGDERYVPFTDERNNAKMAFDTLLDHVPVPKSQIHIMRTDIPAEESASEYESILDQYFAGA